MLLNTEQFCTVFCGLTYCCQHANVKNKVFFLLEYKVSFLCLTGYFLSSHDFKTNEVIRKS